jgi:uncharacterized membrane protein YidH (DUF202 family)
MSDEFQTPPVLAEERTTWSWVRTFLAVSIGAFAVARLTVQDARGLAVTSIALGVISLGTLSVLIHIRNRRHSALIISGRTSLTLALAVMALAVVSIAGVATGSFNL